MTSNVLDHETQKIIYRGAVGPQKSSTPNHRLAPHGGEVSESSDPSEDKSSAGSPMVPSEGSSPKQKTPTEMKRIHLDPILCLLLTQKTSLGGHSFCLLKKMGRDIEPKIIDHENGHRVENTNFILDIGNGKVEEWISYNQLLEHLETAQDTDLGFWIKSFLSSEPTLNSKVL